MLDLEAREQGDVIAIAFDALDVIRHHNAHKRGRLVSDIVRIDQNFANIWREVITDGPDDQTGFEVNQNGCRVVLGGTIDGSPELHQVGHVPLELFGVATNTGGASNNAHAGGNGELVHCFAQFLTLFALDAA